ncbi:9143_t:CDS:2 [Gigaspora margarita]|uniref:9143_t:CDS:1 n=1 Tax=Gigaspora margarita TaxID=4874 RepID=A0ABM8VZ05_GIGMA|nr:9143_t:CDS:2 [Gigaspora margarita]
MSTTTPPAITASVSGEVNRIRRLLAWYRAHNPNLGSVPANWNIGDAVPGGVVTAQTVLAEQRPIWVRIYKNLNITTPDANDNKVKSSMLFATMETVSKEIMAIGVIAPTMASKNDENIQGFSFESDTIPKDEENVVQRDDPDYLVQNFQNIQIESSPEISENEEEKTPNKRAKTFNVEQNDIKDNENVALLKMFSEQMKTNSDKRL